MTAPIAVVVGTRPELVKMGPVLRELRARGLPYRFVHTGQHYDANMSEVFLKELELPPVDAFLGVGSGSHARQIGDALVALETYLSRTAFACVLVQGDTNTALAGALIGTRMGIRVGHVEAGLRSHDWRMPEEHNRLVADHLSDLLFAPTPASAENLRREAVRGEVHVTGNTVIDAVDHAIPLAERYATIPVPEHDFILATAHRAENVDDPRVLAELIRVLVASPIHVVYTVHPRTRARLQTSGGWDELVASGNVTLLEPLGYFDFLRLMRRARLILTDSGGIQEEATAPALRKRVLVIRTSTERPEAIESGHARLVGTEAKSILRAIEEEVERPDPPLARTPFGDGTASRRIVDILSRASG